MANNFNPDKDIPDLSGKVILVTGGTAGLGQETIKQLSKHNPAKIFLAARNAAKAKTVIAAITKEVPKAEKLITFVEMDLSSFDSIKSAAAAVKQQTKDLHILINNAGIMATPSGTTREGYEIQFGTNHMGHALLTRLLLPTLLKTARGGDGGDGGTAGAAKQDVRIVNVSSAAEGMAPKQGYDFAKLKTDTAGLGTFARYGLSKLANVHHARVLARRHPELTIVAIHPGTVGTDLGNGMMQHYPRLAPVFNLVGRVLLSVVATSVQNGARNQLWAATAQGVKSGENYWPVGVMGKGTAATKNDEMADKLWEWTEKELDAHN